MLPCTDRDSILRPGDLQSVDPARTTAMRIEKGAVEQISKCHGQSTAG